MAVSPFVEAVATEGRLSRCHVYIETPGVADALPEMDDMEDAMLDISFVRKDTSRLSCQIMLEDSMPDLSVVIAPPL